MKWLFVLLVIAIAVSAYVFAQQPQKSQYINPAGKTLAERIRRPQGFVSVALMDGSFGAWLRALKLKPDGAVVHYYDGRPKNKAGVYVAVVDMPIGNKDLQQCADVVMHVRAEYLFSHGKKDKIHFTFTNGFRADFSKWAAGYRVAVKGNKTSWIKKAAPDDSYTSLCQYMDVIYTYCGTLSLSRELVHADYKDMQPGDVLIKGGTPGHAELVLDVAENFRKQKVYLMSQSYMPAQEMQVLANPEDALLSPWYALDENANDIHTPEWDFTTNQLMRFNDE